MPTPIFCCGAECGVTAIGTSALSTNGRHWSTFGATATNVANTDPTGPDMPGVRTWKFNPSAATTDTLTHLFPTAIASGGSCVIRFKLQFSTLPNAVRTIVSSVAGLNGLRYNPTGTQLEAWAGAATTTVAGAFVPVVGTIYNVECRFVTGTTHSTEWRIDAVAQATASKAAQSAATQTGVVFGSNGTGQGGNASATGTYYIDDILVSGTDGDYPLGPGTITGLFPNADGTHVYTGNSFSADAGGPFASSATTIWTHLHDSVGENGLQATIGPFVSQVATHTGYVEFTFDDLSVTPASVNGVELITEHHGSTTGAHTQSLRLEDGATEAIVLALVDSSDVTVSYNSKHYATAPSTSGAWTKTLIDALKLRWGYSNDVIGNPILDGACLEVDYITSGSAQALTGNGAVASAGNADVLLAAALDGKGAVAAGGAADLLLAASLTGSGAVASAGVADLLLNADLRGHGDVSSAGRAQLCGSSWTVGSDVVNASVTDVSSFGHGDIASGGRADLTVTCPPLNPSVEAGTSSPDFWSALGGGTATWSTAEAHTGTHSLRVAAVLSAWRSDGFTTTGNTNYTLSAWVKGTGSADSYLTVYWNSTPSNTGDLGNSFVTLTDTYTDWSQITLNVVAPSSALYAQLDLQTTTGDLFGDDFSLCPVSLVILDGHADIASAGTGDLLLAADLAGHGDAASGGRADLLLLADLQAHGDASNAGNADLLLLADLRGHGDVATTGVADLLLAADLQSHGDAASGGNADLLLLADLRGHGDIASGGSADLFLGADLAGHGDAASGGTAELTKAGQVDLDGHGDIASAGRADLLLAADLQAHGDASSAGNADLLLLADLQGHGDASTTGQADLVLSADLRGHGDASSAGQADLLLGADLQGSGAVSTAGRADLLLAADLQGHGDAASGGTAELLKQGQVDLDGAGAAASGGSADLILTVALDGHGDAASAGVAAVQAALALEGHGDAASGGTLITDVAAAVTAAADSYSGRRRNRILTITVRFVYPAEFVVTAEIEAQARTRCPRPTQFRAELVSTLAFPMEANSRHRYRVLNEADRLRDDLDAMSVLLRSKP